MTLPIPVKFLDPRGFGYWEYCGKAYASHGVLPGDELVMREGDDGDPVPDIVKLSPDRGKSDCSFYGPCGGCDLLELKEKARVKAKSDLLYRYLAQLGSTNFLVHPFQASPKIVQYRPRVRLHQGRNKLSPAAGYLPAETWGEKIVAGVVQVTSCPLLMKSLNQRLVAARKALVDLPFRVRGLHLTSFADGSKVSGHLVLDKGMTPRRALPNAERIVKAIGLSGLTLESEPGKVSEVIGSPEVEGLIAPNFPGGPYLVEPSVFCQGNIFQNSKLISWVEKFVVPTDGKRILEGFSGAGNFTIPLGLAGCRVEAVESHVGAVRMAYKNARKAGIKDRVTLHQGDAAKELEKIGGPAEVLLIDPPREGMPSLPKLSKLVRPDKIVYVSCNIETFVRDGKGLEREGYVLNEIVGIDLYPRTSHLEIVALFDSGAPSLD